ncbi:MAG: hypothetical protein K5858_10590 [Lachnospiraceae bacterium]|nr:hypothetical protein [Lachnospiraceae bacterium]
MAFCKYCGKELQEGELCDCEKAVAARAAENAAAQAPAQEAPQAAPAQQAAAPQTAINAETVAAVKGAAGNAFKVALGVLKRPTTGVREYVKEGTWLSSGILLGVNALVYAIFTAIIVGQINKGLGGYYKIGAGPFFVTILYAALSYAGLSCLCLLMSKFFKLTDGFKESVNLVAARSVMITLMVVLSWIFMLFSTTLVICALYFGGLFGTILIARYFGVHEGVHKDIYPYALIVFFVLVGVVSYVIFRVVGPLYVPKEVREYFKEAMKQLTNLKNFNPSSLINNLF